MPSPVNRLSLGTVQFGLDYGIANTTGKVSEVQVQKILHKALTEGLGAIDTASSYGNSEAVLGKFLKSHADSFKIVTKLAPVNYFSAGFVQRELEQSLEQLHVPQVHGY